MRGGWIRRLQILTLVNGVFDCLLSAGTSSCKTLRHGGWQAGVYSAGAQDAIYIWSSKYFVCVLYLKWKAVIAGTCELSISCLCYVIISTNI